MLARQLFDRLSWFHRQCVGRNNPKSNFFDVRGGGYDVLDREYAEQVCASQRATGCTQRHVEQRIGLRLELLERRRLPGIACKFRCETLYPVRFFSFAEFRPWWVQKESGCVAINAFPAAVGDFNPKTLPQDHVRCIR